MPLCQTWKTCQRWRVDKPNWFWRSKSRSPFRCMEILACEHDRDETVVSSSSNLADMLAMLHILILSAQPLVFSNTSSPPSPLPPPPLPPPTGRRQILLNWIPWVIPVQLSLDSKISVCLQTYTQHFSLKAENYRMQTFYTNFFYLLWMRPI